MEEFQGRVRIKGQGVSRYICHTQPVLVGYDNKKRLDWPVGLGVFLFSGSDSCIQVVRVKTATGELTRPVQHVFPLVISQQEPQFCSHNAKNAPTGQRVGTQASWR